MFYPSGEFINVRASRPKVKQAEHATFLFTIVQGGEIFFFKSYFLLKHCVNKVLCVLQ